MDQKDRDEINRLRRQMEQMELGAGRPQGQPGRTDSDSDRELDDYVRNMREDTQFGAEDERDEEELFRRSTQRLRTQAQRAEDQAKKEKLKRMKIIHNRGYRVSGDRIYRRYQPQYAQAISRQRRQALYPQRQRRLPQILQDYRRRRMGQQWTPQVRSHYYGSPAVQRSRQLVDRSRYVLRNRPLRADPQALRRQSYRKIKKKEWKPYRHRQTFRSPYMQREIDYSKTKELMAQRRRSALSGEPFADPPDPDVKPVVPLIPEGMEEIPEYGEYSGSTGFQYFNTGSPEGSVVSGQYESQEEDSSSEEDDEDTDSDEYEGEEQ